MSGEALARKERMVKEAASRPAGQQASIKKNGHWDEIS
jgi:hypothetical protein